MTRVAVLAALLMTACAASPAGQERWADDASQDLQTATWFKSAHVRDVVAAYGAACDAGSERACRKALGLLFVLDHVSLITPHLNRSRGDAEVWPPGARDALVSRYFTRLVDAAYGEAKRKGTPEAYRAFAERFPMTVRASKAREQEVSAALAIAINGSLPDQVEFAATYPSADGIDEKLGAATLEGAESALCIYIVEALSSNLRAPVSRLVTRARNQLAARALRDAQNRQVDRVDALEKVARDHAGTPAGEEAFELALQASLERASGDVAALRHFQDQPRNGQSPLELAQPASFVLDPDAAAATAVIVRERRRLLDVYIARASREEETLAAREAAGSGDLRTMRAFVRNYAEGRDDAYEQGADDAIGDAARKLVHDAAAKLIEAPGFKGATSDCDDFLKAFPNSPRRTAVVAVRARLKRDEVARAQREEQEKQRVAALEALENRRWAAEQKRNCLNECRVEQADCRKDCIGLSVALKSCQKECKWAWIRCEKQCARNW